MVFWVGHLVLKRIIIQPKLNERRAYLMRYTLGYYCFRLVKSNLQSVRSITSYYILPHSSPSCTATLASFVVLAALYPNFSNES